MKHAWASEPFRPARARNRRRIVATVLDGWVHFDREEEHAGRDGVHWSPDWWPMRPVRLNRVWEFAENGMAIDPLSAAEVRALAMALESWWVTQAAAQTERVQSELDAERG